MVKLHGQCNAPGDVIGTTLKCSEDEAKGQMKNIRLGGGETT